MQTFLRLARAGLPVELVATPPDGGLVLFHAKDKRVVAGSLRRTDAAVLVAVRGDRIGLLTFADFEVVQNRTTADERRRFFVPSWPQPGLVPRDERRGNRLTRLAYKGYLENLHPAFSTREWTEFLAARGVEWVCDAVHFGDGGNDRDLLNWPDFHDVDAVLAVRPPGMSTRHKPAAKLYNCWLAGVPALLGPEPAYRELRRSELDYLEVDSLASAQSAVERLLDEPALRRAMVENGARRALDFTPEVILSRWVQLLFELLPQRASAERGGRLERVPLLRRWVRRAAELRWGFRRGL